MNIKYFILFILVIICSCQNADLPVDPDDENQGVVPTLEIGGYTLNDSKDLETETAYLQNVRKIGTLLIEDFSATGLGIFEKVEEIEHLAIRRCPNLESLDGINHFDITGSIKISRCDQLTITGSFPNIDTIEVVWFAELENVSEINAFPSLVDIRENLFLHNLPNLQSVSFSPLVTVGRDLTITKCPQLEEIHFEQVDSVGIDLILSSVNKLENLDGFEDLTKVWTIQLDNNEILVNIDALETLEEALRIHISQNPIEDYCPLKKMILENPSLQTFQILTQDFIALDESYFESCD